MCLGLHFRLQWTCEEATQCDKRVILRVRQQSLQSHSISGRSQWLSGRERQGGWTFQPLQRHWSGCEEGSEERVGCRDQGVCKEDVSGRLGLSYTIHSKTRGFLSQSHHLWNTPPPCFVVYFITTHLFSKVVAVVFPVGSQCVFFFFFALL